MFGAAISDDTNRQHSIKAFNSNKFYEFVGTASFAWEGMAALAVPLATASSEGAKLQFRGLFVWTTAGAHPNLRRVCGDCVAGITAVYSAFGIINVLAYGVNTQTVLSDNLDSFVLRRVIQVS